MRIKIYTLGHVKQFVTNFVSAHCAKKLIADSRSDTARNVKAPQFN